MGKVLLYSLLLILGLFLSQALPWSAAFPYEAWKPYVRASIMVGLSFIMIRVGHGFVICKENCWAYIGDYGVAALAAALPWLLVAAYGMFFMMPRDWWGLEETWTELLLVARFASPTFLLSCSGACLDAQRNCLARAQAPGPCMA